MPKLKEAFPCAEIIIRGDAGFAVPELYEYCESEWLKYVIGLIRNDVLERMIEALLNKAHKQYTKTGQKQRMFAEGAYQTRSWEKERRVTMKAEWLMQGPNSRFVVTNLFHGPKELSSTTMRDMHSFLIFQCGSFIAVLLIRKTLKAILLTKNG